QLSQPFLRGFGVVFSALPRLAFAALAGFAGLAGVAEAFFAPFGADCAAFALAGFEVFGGLASLESAASFSRGTQTSRPDPIEFTEHWARPCTVTIPDPIRCASTLPSLAKL